MCSVYLSEPDSRTLTLRATKGLEASAVGRVQLARGEGLVGQAAEKGEPVAAGQAQQHPGFRYFPGTGEERFASLAAVPMVVGGVAVGVLVVQTIEERDFGPADVEMLQTCAQLIAPLVLNATLLDLVAGPDEDRVRFVDELARAGVAVRGEAPKRAERNVELRGMPSSTGIAIGPIYLLEDPLDWTKIEYTGSGDPERERDDLHRALTDARRELDDIIGEMGQQFGPEFAAVFNTHIQILEDKGFLARLDRRIGESGNALLAVRSVIDEYRELFGKLEDTYFQERGVDVDDVGRRVAAKLLGVRHHNIPLSEGSVVVTPLILPAHFTMLETEKVAAIVTEHGGVNSHGAIFARSLEIPAVTGIGDLTRLARPGELAAVDGIEGRVVLSPDERVLEKYRDEKQRFDIRVGHLDALCGRASETRDGRAIALTANVGLLADLRQVKRHGVDGIGLFRTELIALAHRGIPDEDEQERLYARVSETLAPAPVTIRTLDLGGDKPIPGMSVEREDNPQLGCRSIRLSLRDEESFRTQLRAILRANRAGNIRLLLPMISSIEELRRARELLRQTQRDLEERGVRLEHELRVGVMIEVPSAALIADALARECDFFSIGTNDLTQYVLAVDRGNDAVAHLYKQMHPAVLALIHLSAQAAARAGIPVSVCGELAIHPLAAPLLVGLGIGELSGTARGIPIVKEIIRALDSADLMEDAHRALQAASTAEVEEVAIARIESSGLLDHPDLGPWLRDNILARKGRVAARAASQRAVGERPASEVQ